MLRPINAISFLMLLSLGACNKNHRYQMSFRAGEREQLPPSHTVRMTEPFSPGPETLESLYEGRTLYENNCIACHGLNGKGDGIVTKKGLTPPPSFTQTHLRAKNREHIVEVLTKGYGRMPSMQRRLTESQRWAVASYVKALQLSRYFPAKDLKTSDLKRLP